MSLLLMCLEATAESEHGGTLIALDPPPPVSRQLGVHPLYMGLQVGPLGKASAAMITLKRALP